MAQERPWASRGRERIFSRGILPPSSSEGSPVRKRTDSPPSSWQRRSGRSPGSGIIRERAAFPSSKRTVTVSCSSRPPSQLRGSAGISPASLLRRRSSPVDPRKRLDRYVGAVFRPPCNAKSRRGPGTFHGLFGFQVLRRWKTEQTVKRPPRCNPDLTHFTHGILHNIARDAFNAFSPNYSAEELYGKKKEELLVEGKESGLLLNINPSVTK